MILLKVKYMGAKYSELTLEKGQIYFIGRSPKSNIVLDSTKGISRKHLRIFEDNDVWVVESLSRLGNLMLDGESVSSIELGHLAEFSAGPYIFTFEEVSTEASVKEDSSGLDNIEHTAATKTSAESSKTKQNALVSKVNQSNPHHPVADDNQTVPLNTSLKAFIKIVGTETGNDSILELEGNLWVAGRDPACEIHIDDHHASRNHFEIKRVGQEFFVSDLGSANGTELNGEELTQHKKMKILSGDKISIQSVSIFLEVRDVDFESKFESAKKQLATIPAHNMNYQQNGFPPSQHSHHPMMMQLPPPDFTENGVFEDEGIGPRRPIDHLKNFDFKKHKIKVIIAALIPLFIIGLMDDGESEKKKQKESLGSRSKTFDTLTDEQKIAVKDMFTLSQQHFHTLKYELCLSELKKLHQIIPSYENSKKLKGFCEQGAILLRQEEDRVANEKKQQESEQKITTTVEFCQSKTTATTTLEDAQNCLQQAMELDPGHPNIIAYLEEIKQREINKQNQANQAAARSVLRQKGRAHWARAKRLAAKNELAKAVEVYKSFLGVYYPGLTKEKSKAKRELASVKKKLNEKIDTLISECESLRSNSKFKDAWSACDKATIEDPSNEKAKELKKTTLSDLRKEMKSIYQDSILEESLGNVDAAKEKWRLIRKNDLEFDDFYKKATRKLKKYGEGI